MVETGTILVQRDCGAEHCRCDGFRSAELVVLRLRSAVCNSKWVKPEESMQRTPFALGLPQSTLQMVPLSVIA